MKTTHVTVKFPGGLHARPASRLINLIRRFRSQVQLRKGTQLVNGRSILNILLLAAACNAELDVLAVGDDEDDAIQAVESFFQLDGSEDAAITFPHTEFAQPDPHPPQNAAQ